MDRQQSIKPQVNKRKKDFYLAIEVVDAYKIPQEACDRQSKPMAMQLGKGKVERNFIAPK